MSFPVILVVAGDAAVRDKLSALLTRHGTATVLLAHSQAQALALARRDHPDIILADAEMSGLDVAPFLVPSDESMSVPVVIQLYNRPDSAMEEQLGRASERGCVINAPFDPATLAKQVQYLAELTWFNRKFADITDLGGMAFVAELIDTFIDLGTTGLAAIRAAASARDFATISRTAHSLKSTAANLGAEMVRAAATHLESQAIGKASDSELAQSANELAATFDRARQFLLQHRDRLPEAPGGSRP